MSSEKRTARSVFDLVVEVTSADEQRILADQLCAENLDLRARVEQLLVAHRMAQSFLETSPIVANLDRSNVKPSEVVGSVIGPYRLVEQIGEGGFGHVFVAEQQQPVQRRVALKLIKPGMNSREVVARFEAERQALAIMNHANIAKVFDAGTTSSGLPYFVMELVPGVPITDYCDQNSLSPRERMELFIPVCLAIQHSHQKGIIHRDIKPSNVLVTSQDGRPVAKVIDFGVAKALHGMLTDLSLQTGLQQVLGTPLYMSPEQAGSPSTDVDTRSDIYSLGVLLYELITGTTPFERQRFAKAAFDEIRRIIREEDPPKPSSRLSHSGDRLPNIAAQRRIEPARLSKMIQGDLDWIVMKALEKDRARRYSSAENLAKDIERHLHHEPVEAGPPGGWYRMRKLARRHRNAMIMSLSLLTFLFVGTAVSLWQAIRATRAERVATENGQRAAEEAAVARAVNEFLLHDLLGQADISNQAADSKRNPNITVRELLDRAATGIETRFRGQRRTEAAIRLTLGQTYMALADYAEAEKHLMRSVELHSELLGSKHPETLESLGVLGGLYHFTGRNKEAEQLLNEVLTQRRAQLDDTDPLVLASIEHVAAIHKTLGRYSQAATMYERVVKDRMVAYGAENTATLHSMSGLASLYNTMGRFDEAIRLLDQVVAGNRKTLGNDHPQTLSAMSRLADVYASYGGEGRFKEAEPLYRQVAEAYRTLLGRDHPDTISSMNDLALCYHKMGRYSEALPLLQDVLAAEQARWGDDHSTTLNAMNDLAIVYVSLGRFNDATPMLERVVAGWTASLGPEHPKTLASINNLALACNSSGRHDDVEPLLKQSLAGHRKSYGNDHPLTLGAMSNLGGYYLDRGRLEDAEPLFREALKVRRDQLGPDNLDTLTSLNQVALVKSARKQWDAAERDFQEVIKGRRAKLGDDHPDTIRAMNNLAIVYRDSGRLDEGERLFRQVLDARNRVLGKDNFETLRTQYHLALLLEALDRPDDAQPLFLNAVQGIRKVFGLGHAQTQQFIHAFADYCETRGRASLAEPALRDLLTHFSASDGSESASFATAMVRLARNLLAQERFTDAEPLAREALAIRVNLEPDAWTTFGTRSILGAALCGEGRYAEAEPLLLDAYQGMKERQTTIPSSAQDRISEARRQIIQLYKDWGKDVQAKRWKESEGIPAQP